jgi:hypothetical protein
MAKDKKDKVKMTKEDETIFVSPLVVEDHKNLGWKVVESNLPETAEKEPTKDQA